jgi:hypothetical protein
LQCWPAILLGDIKLSLTKRERVVFKFIPHGIFMALKIDNFPLIWINLTLTYQSQYSTIQRWKYSSNILNYKHFLIFDNLLIVNLAWACWFINEYDQKQGYAESDHLRMQIVWFIGFGSWMLMRILIGCFIFSLFYFQLIHGLFIIY